MKFKKILLPAILLTIPAVALNAQTNTFPSSGNVGIGITSPVNKLQVVGDIWVGNSSTATNNGVSINAGNSSTAGSANVNRLRFGGSDANSTYFTVQGPSNIDYLTINNGKIGIGITNPSTLLHVSNPNDLGQTAGNIAEIARFSGSTTNNSQLRIQLKRNSNGTDWYTASTRLQCVTDVTNQGYFEFNPQGAGSAAAIGVGGSEIIRFNSNGNVLIGRETQSNTSFKLDINGPAHATKVVVNSDGADFVFDSSYALRPLNEVENFIQQNHHLPEIAPASDMQANGVDLGDNQTKLLQKIEELTLYIIQQNKVIESLKNRLDRIEKN